MQKKTLITGHLQEIMIMDATNKQVNLPDTTTIILKDENLTIEILILKTTDTNKHIGHYTIIIKQP